MANIIVSPQDFSPQNVKVWGPGIEANGAEIGKKTEFFIDHKTAGVAPLEVKVNDSKGQSVDKVEIVESSEGVKKVSYTPQSLLPHTVQVNFGNTAVPKSPFRVYVKAPFDPTKVVCFGPWLENNYDLKPQQTTHFVIDTK